MLLALPDAPPFFLYTEADSGIAAVASGRSAAVFALRGLANPPNTNSAPSPVATAAHAMPVCIACTKARSA